MIQRHCSSLPRQRRRWTRVRRCGFTVDAPGPATQLTVTVKAPATSHGVRLSKIEAWLQSGGRSANEQSYAGWHGDWLWESWSFLLRFCAWNPRSHGCAAAGNAPGQRNTSTLGTKTPMALSWAFH